MLCLVGALSCTRLADGDDDDGDPLAPAWADCMAMCECHDSIDWYADAEACVEEYCEVFFLDLDPADDDCVVPTTSEWFACSASLTCEELEASLHGEDVKCESEANASFLCMNGGTP